MVQPLTWGNLSIFIFSKGGVPDRLDHPAPSPEFTVAPIVSVILQDSHLESSAQDRQWQLGKVMVQMVYSTYTSSFRNGEAVCVKLLSIALVVLESWKCRLHAEGSVIYSTECQRHESLSQLIDAMKKSETGE